METAELTAITRIDQLDPDRQYTYADYLTWQFSERVDLLRGYFRQMATPNKLDDAGCIGAPDWVIEILSKGNSKKERCAVALREEFSIYEEAGVREYWVVQPEYDNILVYVLNDSGHYEAKPTLLSTDETVSPVIFPDLILNLNEVFAD